MKNVPIFPESCKAGAQLIDIEGIIVAANRAQQAEDAGLESCSRIWHVGFFFDEIHRNIDQDASEQRLSNVAPSSGYNCKSTRK